jgi:hypothetical protein
MPAVDSKIFIKLKYIKKNIISGINILIKDKKS